MIGSSTSEVILVIALEEEKNHELNLESALT